ncbi:MAG: thiamine phosphate synthase [Microcystaceae cyanobacterium]
MTNAIARILDANLDRAREGLRIIEEWCRFALNNPQLADHCKKMRQTIAQWHTNDLKIARDTPNDLGTQLSHPQEEERSSITHLLVANLGRLQESLRVIEEYGKLYQEGMGTTFKQLRYEAYTLESRLISCDRLKKLQEAPLYLVTSPSDQLFSVVESALKGGLKIVQYRDKNGDDYKRWQNAAKLCQLCHDYDALFLVNDRVDLAIAVKADGVHLGQQDLPVKVARELLGNQAIIGKSTTSPQEMTQTLAENPDYVGVGPVYATPTKAGKTPVGLSYIQYAVKHCPIPWFAIGGIDGSNCHDVRQAGAKQIAVVRAIMDAENPKVATEQLS